MSSDLYIHFNNFFHKYEYEKYNIVDNRMVDEIAQVVSYILYECALDGFQVRLNKQKTLDSFNTLRMNPDYECTIDEVTFSRNLPFRHQVLESPFKYPILVKYHSTEEYLNMFPIFQIHISHLDKTILSNMWYRLTEMFSQPLKTFNNDILVYNAIAYFMSILSAYNSVYSRSIELKGLIENIAYLATQAVVRYTAFYTCCALDIPIERVDPYSILSELNELLWIPIQSEGHFDHVYPDKNTMLVDIYDYFGEEVTNGTYGF
jgi:hypothetical protein